MASVAGDFYDFIVVDDKHIGILVADVSGHGMPAALVASMLENRTCGAGTKCCRSRASSLRSESDSVRKVSGDIT